MQVTSIAERRSSAGSRPGSRRASIVLPAPGGPTSSRWCPPAAATSTARRGDRLAADVGEIGRRLAVFVRSASRVLGPRGVAPEGDEQLVEGGDRPHDRLGDGGRLGVGLGRDDHGAHAGLAGEDGHHRHQPWHRADPPVEAQLADEGQPVGGLAGHDLGRDRHADGDGDVEAAAQLLEARRREVDRDPLGVAGPRRSGGGEGDPDAVQALAAGGVGLADQGDAREAGGDVDLDEHGAAPGPLHGGGVDASEHGGPPRIGCLRKAVAAGRRAGRSRRYPGGVTEAARRSGPAPRPRSPARATY